MYINSISLNPFCSVAVIHVIAAYMPYRTLHNGIENEYDSLVSLDS